MRQRSLVADSNAGAFDLSKVNSSTDRMLKSVHPVSFLQDTARMRYDLIDG